MCNGSDPQYVNITNYGCRKSCDTCNNVGQCKNSESVERCNILKKNCNRTDIYGNIAREKCQLTCNSCSGSTSTTSTVTSTISTPSSDTTTTETPSMPKSEEKNENEY